ncbi:MAG: ATP-dependent zinc metalloprotease FtsH [Candidatus Longimicrobiales bacterium M2_2A_002]
MLWLLAILVLGWWALDMPGQGGPTISYTTFRAQVADGNVTEVVVQGERVRGTLADSATHVAAGDTTRYSEFVTFLPSFGDEELLTLLREQGVRVETRPTSDGGWWTLLLWVAPILFLFGIGWLAYRRMQTRGQNILNIGESGAKLYDRTEEETTFDDVAGVESAKEELREVIEFLKDPTRFQELGAEVPKGVLMVGPPGSGKTLLARAVAGEADVPFFIITGSDFMEMFVGVGAKRVRDLFERAKDEAPAIIFIDELDSIGRQRGAGLGGGHDEREQTLNQLLSELDGFEPNESVIVMAATNRPDILDEALLRPGRFDRRITVDLPTATERQAILELHGKDKPLDPEVDLESVAKGTPGFSGADLENLLNEAALTAAREDAERITQDHVEEARDRVLMGLERQGLALSDRQVELLSYHEGGHALVAASLAHADPIHKVTIVPRGRSMGSTHQLPDDERYIHERAHMLDRLAVMLGGRAAERTVFDTLTSGAEDDLQQATSLARKMVLKWGMSERIGPMASASRREQVFLGEEIAQRRDYSDETARVVDEEVMAIIDDAFERATTVLEEKRDALDRVAEVLQEEEEITGDRVREILDEQSVEE